MSYVLGIDIGGSTTAAAVCRRTGDGGSSVRPLPLDARSATVESALELTAEGFVAGSSVDGHSGGRVVTRDFVHRVGDDVPLVIDGVAYPAQALTGALARWVLEVAWRREGSAPERVVVTHPAAWGPYRVDLLRRAVTAALDDTGVDDPVPLPRPVAVALGHEVTGRLPGAGLLAVYRLGGRGAEVAVLEALGPGTFRLLAAAEADGAAGDAADDALHAHVLSRVAAEGGSGSVTAEVSAQLHPLCGQARAALSATGETRIAIPGGSPLSTVEMRVTRAELEPLIQPILHVSVDLLLETIRSCGAGPADVSATLLAGAAAATPLVTELLDDVLPGTVRSDRQPGHTAATGAAAAARRAVSAYPPPAVPYPRQPAPAGRATASARAATSPWSDDAGPGWPQGAGQRWDDPDRMEAEGRPLRPPVRVTPLETDGRDLANTHAGGRRATSTRRGRGAR